MSNRDDFLEPVRRALAERAAYMCSYDGCRELTVMPASDPVKSIKTGRAAHICAAAPGGPRWDKKQAPEERASIQNAIYLCARHADIIDKDMPKHTADVLRAWKSEHEAWVAQNDLIPSPPTIAVETAHGLISGSAPGKITGEMVARFRDHVMRIGASSRHELLDLELRVQFPEAVVTARPLRGGSAISIERDEQNWVAHCSGSASAEILGEPPPTSLFIMRIEVLRSGRAAEIAFRCIPNQHAPDPVFGPDAVHYYIEGKFLYRHREQIFEKSCIYVLQIDAERRVTCQRLTKAVQLVKEVRFP